MPSNLTQPLTVTLVCIAILAAAASAALAFIFLLGFLRTWRMRLCNQEETSKPAQKLSPIQVETVRFQVANYSINYPQQQKNPEDQTQLEKDENKVYLDPCDTDQYCLLEEFGLVVPCCHAEELRMKTPDRRIKSPSQEFNSRCATLGRALLGLSVSQNGRLLICHLLKLDVRTEFDSEQSESSLNSAKIRAEWWLQAEGESPSPAPRWSLAKTQQLTCESGTNSAISCCLSLTRQNSQFMTQSVMLHLEISSLDSHFDILVLWYPIASGRRLEWRHFLVNSNSTSLQCAQSSIGHTIAMNAVCIVQTIISVRNSDKIQLKIQQVELLSSKPKQAVALLIRVSWTRDGRSVSEDQASLSASSDEALNNLDLNFQPPEPVDKALLSLVQVRKTYYSSSREQVLASVQLCEAFWQQNLRRISENKSDSELKSFEAGLVMTAE